MAISKAITDTVGESEATQMVHQFVRHLVNQVSAEVQKFIRNEREKIICGNPSKEDLELHRLQLKQFLRLVRMLHAEVADHDYADRSLERILSNAVWKLEQSWEMLYSSMSDEEADKLLAEIFPNEPRA